MDSDSPVLVGGGWTRFNNFHPRGPYRRYQYMNASPFNVPQSRPYSLNNIELPDHGPVIFPANGHQLFVKEQTIFGYQINKINRSNR
jgi:hypothetical protein